MSSRKDNSFSISIRPVEYVHIQVPVERRERRKTTSFTMPPSVVQAITAYAKRRHMSTSDFVTLLCVSFLEGVSRAEEASDAGRGVKSQAGPQHKP